MYSAAALPTELPLLLLRGMVIFPLTVTPLAVSRLAAVRLIDDAIAAGSVIAVATQRGDNNADHFAVGVVATPHRLVRLHDGTLRVALEATERIAIDAIIAREPYPRAQVRRLPDRSDDRSVAPLMEEARARARELLDALSGTNDELRAQLDAAADPVRLAALLAANLLVRAGLTERQALLELPSAGQRLAELNTMLAHELAVLRGHFRI